MQGLSWFLINDRGDIGRFLAVRREFLETFEQLRLPGVSDVTDLAGHTSQDCDLNHVPDECQAAPSCVVPFSTSGWPTSPSR